jgi:hypothetical protein
MIGHQASRTGLISIARDYSRTPGPRFVHQGPFSGEAFRSKLADLLKSYEHVEVDLDGTVGYGSSFIDEAFGGLVRNAAQFGLDPALLARRISFKSQTDPSYAEEAVRAMSEALKAASGMMIH